MKRINDEEMKKMLGNGMTQREVAKRFGVTEQAVSKRLKQLKSLELPESFLKLTRKQQNFALAIAEGKSKTDAAMTAFDCQDRTSAKALGHNQAKDPDVLVAIQDLLHQEGIGRRRRIQRLRAMIECQDLSIAGKGLDIAHRLTGEYKEQETNIDYIQNVVTIIKEIQLQRWEEGKTIEDKPVD